MSRARVHYICQQCGTAAPRWLGRCPECGSWNSLAEEPLAPAPGRFRPEARREPVPIARLEPLSQERLSTGLAEFDRVLGGGIVPGAAMLLAGDPGIGKSTLLLQAASGFSRHSLGEGGFARDSSRCCLYVSAEESLPQVQLRSRRLAELSPELLLLAENELAAVEEQLEKLRPGLTILDSIQAISDSQLGAAAGTIGQVRQCAERLVRLGKDLGLALFLVGHVTKEGAIAGPRLLEHMVDTVLYLEGDRHSSYRLLRAVKNRFGSSDELGLFEMGPAGLAEVTNPSEMFLRQRRPGVPGSAVVPAMEGSRPLLVEVQALVSPPAPVGLPRRTTTGVDYHRASLVLAVLEKRAGLQLASRDVFINLPGGIRVEEPAADLAIALAVASSYLDRPLPAQAAFLGEIGLTGEIRAVPNLSRRLQEAGRLGFRTCLLPAGASLPESQALELRPVEDLKQAFQIALPKV